MYRHNDFILLTLYTVLCESLTDIDGHLRLWEGHSSKSDQHGEYCSTKKDIDGSGTESMLLHSYMIRVGSKGSSPACTVDQG
jgi:hypothetical protein